MNGELVESPDYPFAQIGYDFMGACFEVHQVLGGGLLEEIYQESLELELWMRLVPFASKQELTVFYKSHQLRKRYIPDLVVAKHVIVEIKVVQCLVPEHEAQVINYMRLTRQPVGYLVNFAPVEKVEWKRFVLSKHAANAV